LMYMYHYFCFSHFSGEPELAGLPWFFPPFFLEDSLWECVAPLFYRPDALPFT